MALQSEGFFKSNKKGIGFDISASRFSPIQKAHQQPNVAWW